MKRERESGQTGWCYSEMCRAQDWVLQETGGLRGAHDHTCVWQCSPQNPHPQSWPFRAEMRVRHLLIFCLCLSYSWPTWGRAMLFLGRLRNLNSEEVDFLAFILVFGTTLIAQMVKNLPAMQETPVRFLGQEDPLEKAMATHSSILAWRIPRTVQSTGSQRVQHDWATFTFTSPKRTPVEDQPQYLQKALSKEDAQNQGNVTKEGKDCTK